MYSNKYKHLRERDKVTKREYDDDDYDGVFDGIL
jgi:hypothetical protein